MFEKFTPRGIVQRMFFQNQPLLYSLDYFLIYQASEGLNKSNNFWLASAEEAEAGQDTGVVVLSHVN